MKISLNWIKDYVSPGISVDQLIHRLTMAGIEAEKIEKTGNDMVIEFEITPNRPDCLNMIGIAKEIAVVLDKPISLPKIKEHKFPKTKCDITISAPQACARYIGVEVEGVQVKEADQKMKQLLAALGNRSISNIVDITNFCLFEIGQPLHAFDLDKLEGKRIIVRFAKKGEKIVTLDGVERELDPSILVIADAERPVAIAGIMGGADTEVTKGTKNILLESAYFDPILIRRTARKLGLSSDSSHRFERGVVYEHVKTGSDRALDFILKFAGGKIASYADVKGSKISRRTKVVTFDIDAMNSFLGAKVSVQKVKRILKALYFSFASSKKNTFKVTAPHWRSDIQRPEDIYEEIARVIGYDNLPSTFPVIKVSSMHSNEHRAKRLEITDYLLSQGFNETLTYSLLGRDHVDAAKVEDFSHMSVLNPLSKEQEVLRPHLLPSLLQVAHININRGQKDLAFFETGKIYPHGGEKEALGILMTGALRQDWRRAQAWPFDFFDLKGSIEKTLAQFGVSNVSFRAGQEPYLEEGQQADIFIGKKNIGNCGKVADTITENFHIKQNADIFFAQIDLEAVYGVPVKKTSYVPICEYPAITRDISIAIDKKIALKDVYAIVKECGADHLKKIDFIEEYLGDKIPQGQRGLVFSVTYQSPKRTLTEEEIQSVHEDMCQKIVDQLGATIR